MLLREVPVRGMGVVRAASSSTTPYRCEYVINRHAHVDYVSANPAFRNEVEITSTTAMRDAVPTVVHDLLRDALAGRGITPGALLQSTRSVFAEEADPERRRE